MRSARDLNLFRFSGPLPPEAMIDRDSETEDLLALADGGHSFRLVGPRRYGKTTLHKGQRAPRRTGPRGDETRCSHSEDTAAAVGIKRSSIGKALESLVPNADVIQEHGRARLTDPMFELWLKARSPTPTGGDDEDNPG